MDYDASTVGTSSAVAVLFQGYATSSAEDGTCTTNDGSAAGMTDAAAMSSAPATGEIVSIPSDRIREGDPGTEWTTPNMLSNEDSDEMSVGGVMKLLEEGSDAAHRKKAMEGDGCCTAFRRRKMLLLGLLALLMVCLVVGLYVAMSTTKRNKSSQTTSETRAGAFVEDEGNAVSNMEEIGMLIPVRSGSVQGDEGSEDGGDSREEELRSALPSAMPASATAPALVVATDSPSPVPTEGSGLDGYCGGGERGNGLCFYSNLCCSNYGWCGTGPAYCNT
jgi:hypothetical protein